MKNLLAMLLALVLTTSVCSAATVKTNTGANLKNAIKKDVEATKKAIKADVERANKDKKAQNKSANKETKAKLKAQRDSQVSTIDNQINQKKQQLNTVKKSTTMTETEQTIKTRAYERQIEALEARKARIDEAYKKSIKALD